MDGTTGAAEGPEGEAAEHGAGDGVADADRAQRLRSARACCRDIAEALLTISKAGGFLPKELAGRIRADLELPDPPLSAEVLANDEIVIRLRKALPADLDMEKLLSQHDGKTCLIARISSHEYVDFELVEALIGRLADMLSALLIGHYGLHADMASYLAASARNELMSRALEAASMERIERYMDSLHDRGRLGGEAMLNYAGRSDPRLFHAALGRVSRLDAEMVCAFIEDGGERVLRRILDRTDFVEPLKRTILTTFLDAHKPRI